ncbi:MAG: GIY-YIG nuclease family protein [Salaquimonas sp.]|nr:GIY-YIG nuclease family protein [Salaquimonas sp.]
MRYICILQSLSDSDRHYQSITGDMNTRLKQHNAGEVFHTAKFRPWRVKNYFAFVDEKKACAFEKYLKSGSVRAFVKRQF